MQTVLEAQDKETQPGDIDPVASDKGRVSDGHHTFDELYGFRRVLTALLFNEWHKRGMFEFYKSYRHADGEMPFGGGWFVVVAETPVGQISFHYENEHWDEFDLPEVDTPPNAWDGHTAADALSRLQQLL